MRVLNANARRAAFVLIYEVMISWPARVHTSEWQELGTNRHNGQLHARPLQTLSSLPHTNFLNPVGMDLFENRPLSKVDCDEIGTAPVCSKQVL
eukprot:2175039-Amphidinium_carterae.1